VIETLNSAAFWSELSRIGPLLAGLFAVYALAAFALHKLSLASSQSPLAARLRRWGAASPLARGVIVGALSLVLLVSIRGGESFVDALLLLAVGLGVAAYLAVHAAFGRWLLRTRTFRRIRVRGLERTILATTLALGAHAILLYSFGVIGISVRLLSGFALIVMLALGRGELRKWILRLAKSNDARMRHQHTWLWWAAFGTVLFQLTFLRSFRVASPPLMFDATWIHLAAAKSYLARDAMDFLPQLRSSHLVPLGQSLFTPVLWLFGELGPKVLELAFFLSLGACSHLLVQRLLPSRHRELGPLAALLVLSSPLVMGLGAICYLGLLAMSYMAMALLLALRWLRPHELETSGTQLGLLTGIFLGFAFLGKVQAWGVFFPIGLILLISLFVKPRSLASPSRRLRSWFPATLALCVSLVAIISPYLVRNAIEIGNPLAPFFTGIFGINDDIMSEAEFQALASMVEHWGMGTGPSDFLALPWRIVAHPERFGGGATWSLGAAWLLALPFGILGLWRRSLWWAAPFVLSFIGPWFAMFQEMRYLLYVLPVLAVVAVSGYARILARSRWALLSATLLILGASTLQNGLFEPLRGSLGLHGGARLSRLDARIPGHRGVAALAEQCDLETRVYQVYLDSARFYFPDPGNFIGDHYGKYRFVELFEFSPQFRFREGGHVVRRLREWNIDYVAIALRGPHDVESFLLRNDPLLARHLRLTLAMDAVLVYAFDPAGGFEPRKETEPERDLLVDPSFEAARATLQSGGAQGNWFFDPKLVQLQEGSARLDPGAALRQNFACNDAEAQSLLLLQFDSRCLADAAGTLTVQVNWLPEQGWYGTDRAGRRLTSVESAGITVQPGVTVTNRLLFTQPPGARTCELLWVNTGGSPIELSRPSWVRADQATPNFKKANAPR
jgi:hypothetical protein